MIVIVFVGYRTAIILTDDTYIDTGLANVNFTKRVIWNFVLIFPVFIYCLFILKFLFQIFVFLKTFKMFDNELSNTLKCKFAKNYIEE